MSAHVIVVGAGPVGLTAALLLADAGVEVTVAERSTSAGDLPRAISIVDETFRTMERIGVAEELKAESLLDTGSRYFGRGDRLLAAAKPVPSRIGHPAKTQFDQPVMESLLWDRAVAHEGIDFRTGVTATRAVQDVRGVAVSVTGPEGSAELRGDWLVGADGGRSFVRDELGVDLIGSTQPQRWIVIDLLNEKRSYEKFADFHCDGVRPYVLVPGIKGRLRIEYMLFDHEDADEMTTPERIRELAHPIRPDLDPADVRRAAVYVAHQRVARHYRVGRAFLIGDAAHLMPPFAGQGLNAGIRDAHNLAWKLIEAARGGATEKLLDSYEVERRTHGAKMVRVSHRIGRVVMATGTVRTKVRDAAVRVVSVVPSIREFLANMRFITPPDYSAGVAVAPSKQVDPALAATVGRALSQPVVTDVDGVRAGLDQHLGAEWALLLVGTGEGLTGVDDPYWTALGARVFRLVDAGEAGSPGAGAAILQDPGRGVSQGVSAPHVLVVRPDKYVAAVYRPHEQAQVVTALRSFIDDRARAASSSEKE